MTKKFIRQESNRFSKLGKNRKKLQKWRKPKGRDSKMRLKRKGYLKKVMVGFKKPQNKEILTLVHNLSELNSLNKNSMIIIAKIGARKKLELIAQAEKQNLKIQNLGGTK